MNLRPTKLKVIFSILIPVALFAVVLKVNFAKFTNLPQIIINFLGLHNLVNVFSKENIVLFVIEVVIVYLILSLLFHRRKQHWNQPIKPLQSNY
jgi:hypothetical protein